jgi:hypothetical protein
LLPFGIVDIWRGCAARLIVVGIPLPVLCDLVTSHLMILLPLPVLHLLLPYSMPILVLRYLLLAIAFIVMSIVMFNIVFIVYYYTYYY